MEKLLGKKWFSRDNLLLLVLLGVLLFVIALPVKKEDSGKGQEKENAAAMLEEVPASTQTVAAGSTEEYAVYLEEKLKKMLEAVQGLGEVEVMVTLESSEEKIVEKDMTAERSNIEEQDAAGGARTVNTSNRVPDDISGGCGRGSFRREDHYTESGGGTGRSGRRGEGQYGR